MLVPWEALLFKRVLLGVRAKNCARLARTHPRNSLASCVLCCQKCSQERDRKWCPPPQQPTLATAARSGIREVGNCVRAARRPDGAFTWKRLATGRRAARTQFP